MKKKANTRILELKSHDALKEMDFELKYLLSLSTEERFKLMFAKSKEIKSLANKNGYRKTAKIIERT